MRKGKRKWWHRYMHQGGTCPLCGRWFPPAEMTRDHVVPRSRGGGTDWDNIQLACAPCNQFKGSRLMEELT